MIELIAFIGMTAFISAEGWIVAHRLLQGSYGKGFEILLGLPLGAVINLLGILLLTIVGISLNSISIVSVNLIATLILLISVQPLLKAKSSIESSVDTLIIVPKALVVLSGFIIAASLIFAVSHVLLPTFHYDSTTNWNMRSKVSYHRAEVVFDSQDGLVSKSNYPFLFHALQISINQFSPNWSDKSANGIHLLLTLSCFGLLFSTIGKKGKFYALIVLALLLGIPLMTLHAGQSYADITLVGFALLSLLMFIEFRKLDDSRLLMLSGVFLSACVWTKSDGLFFCYIPWIIMVAIALVRHTGSIAHLRYPIGFSVIAAMTWPIFATVKELSLTPHGSGDAEIMLNIEAVSAFSSALFVTGSFGIYWYGLFSVLVVLLIGVRRGWDIAVDRRYFLTLLWGLIAMASYMGVYLLTSNTEYLIIGQSFDRQMLLPASLLTLSLSYMVIPRRL